MINMLLREAVKLHQNSLRNVVAPSIFYKIDGSWCVKNVSYRSLTFFDYYSDLVEIYNIDPRAILINGRDIFDLYGANYVDLMCELVNDWYTNGK